MTRPLISVTLITLNEQDNIADAIRSVAWADDVLVVDSGSSDSTVERARALGARVIHHDWPGYGAQKNFAQREAKHDWVLNLDADERVSPELAAAIDRALGEVAGGRSSARGFSFPRKTYYLGRWIRHGGWYPNRLVRLADRRHAAWTEPSVHEELRVDGTVVALDVALDHYAFPSIEEQIRTNLRFARLGTEDLRRRGQRPSVTKLVLKPLGKFFETYLLKGGYRDGLPGFIISVNAAHSMFLKYAYLLESGIRGETE